jgi:hypothetical protein
MRVQTITTAAADGGTTTAAVENGNKWQVAIFRDDPSDKRKKGTKLLEQLQCLVKIHTELHREMGVVTREQQSGHSTASASAAKASAAGGTTTAVAGNTGSRRKGGELRDEHLLEGFANEPIGTPI